jgi:uncharacterized protein YjeT (DUF2065 family)
MALTALEALTVGLGLLCLGWGLLAILYPRFSYIAARDRKPAVEDDEETVDVADPIRWRGWRREEESFTVHAQRRAGAIVLLAGVVLVWVGLS